MWGVCWCEWGPGLAFSFRFVYELAIHRIYYFYYLLFIQLSQQLAARQREPYMYSMCCLRTFCILLLYIFMLSQYVFYKIMHYVK